MGAKLEVRNVSKSFGPLKVLDDVSLALRPGSVTAIIGQSGSGKSTLLRSINHLERVDAGFIAIERGDYARAEAAFEAARRLSSNVEVIEALAGSALARARRGDRTGARLLLGRADSLAGGYETATHPIVYMAQTHAALGNAGPAVTWLTRSAIPGDRHLQLHLRCDPPFDPIAGDPRFQALLLEPRPARGQGC